MGVFQGLTPVHGLNVSYVLTQPNDEKVVIQCRDDETGKHL